MDDYRDVDEMMFDGMTAMIVGVLQGDKEALDLAAKFGAIQLEAIAAGRSRKYEFILKLNDLRLEARDKLKRFLVQ